MVSELTIDDVLDIKYLQAWKWSPAGDHIAYTLDDGGVSDLYIRKIGEDEPRKLSDASDSVGGFDWHPESSRVPFVQDGQLHMAKLSGGEWETALLLNLTAKVNAPSWSPDGENLAFVADGKIWVFCPTTETYRSHSPVGTAIAQAYGIEKALMWSPDSNNVMFHFREDDKTRHLGIMSHNGNLLWRTTYRKSSAVGLAWLDEKTLLFAVSHDKGVVSKLYRGHLPEETTTILKKRRESGIAVVPTVDVETELLCRQEAKGTPGPLRASGVWPGPNGENILLMSEDDGWAHLYMLPANGGQMKQLTFGECEDYGHMGDRPDWSPDGRYICYSSNRAASGERQLWLLDLESNNNHQLTSFTGTNVQPKWNPAGARQLAFVHSDPCRNGDIWVTDVNPDSLAGSETEQVDEVSSEQLTTTTPPNWSDSTVVLPTEVVFEGAQGWDVHGYLIPPARRHRKTPSPGVVWVHGGPVRQMRYGFHPMRSYAIFYAFSQYLAHRGYATLMVNFRGGIGYGREFRNGIYKKMGVDDVADVVAAGRYLKDLSYIDSERVGVWGLSYGGYMTLTALTKYPEEFAVGVNLAGIWDFAQWMRWVHQRRGRQGGLFEIYFDGDPEESSELYRTGSPCAFRENIKRPLVNFHGTADANVDFAQMDRIVKDMVEMGKQYEAYYYPDEEHTFAMRHTWADAFNKIEREFDKYLKQ